MEKRQFDLSFKKMAVELSAAKGSVREAAEELGIGADLLSKWRGRLQKQGSISQKIEHLSEEQQQIRRLQKQLRELEEEHAILKKAVRIFSRDGSNVTNLSKNM
jgi:transposase-like protein